MNRHDLTEGKISSLLINLAAPLFLGNILQQFYNTVDAAVISHCCSNEEFAAAGVAGSVMNLFLFAVAGACTGISIIFAQLYGADNIKSFRQEHFICIAAGIPAVIAASFLGIISLPVILKVIQTPEILISHIESYLLIILTGLPAAYLYNLYSCILRAAGNTRAALLALCMSVGINLLLDLLFVWIMDYGLPGAAAATVISQVISAVTCILYLFRYKPELIFHRGDCSIDHSLLSRTAHFAAVTGFHQSGLYIGKLLVQGAVNTCGTDMISAYTAATRIEGFVNSIGDSGAAAASVLAAQNLGAGKAARVRETFTKSLTQMTFMGIICSVILFLSASPVSALILGAGESSAAHAGAVSYLHLVSLFYIFCFTGNSFAGYFDGCGRISIPFAGAVGHITVRVLLSYKFAASLGLNAVALATGTGWILANIFWTIMYKILNRQQ